MPKGPWKSLMVPGAIMLQQNRASAGEEGGGMNRDLLLRSFPGGNNAPADQPFFRVEFGMAFATKISLIQVRQSQGKQG